MSQKPDMLLVIERDPRLSAKIKKHLKVDELRIFHVESGQDALFLLQSMKPVFVLANLNGFRHWEELKQMHRYLESHGIQALYIEGYKSTREYAARLRLEANSAFMKLPFTLPALVKRIRALRGSGDAMIGLRLGPPGQEVDLVKKLGSGAMGSVYEAVQKSLDRRVAVKFLAEHYQKTDPDSAQRFAIEAKAIAQMRSPHIVHVFFVGEHQGLPYMVMEFVDGPNLDKYLRAKKALRSGEALKFCRQVLLGLDHAHGRGKVHRDLKPANIMLTKEGQVVILDFGLVRAAEGQDLTKVGTVLGTPRYISPEQVKGRKVDHRGDLYALGIILFQMLVGQTPFQSDDYVALLLKHAKEPLPRPEKFGKKIEPPVFVIIENLTRKDPSKRYQSAREAMAAIDACLASANIDSGDTSGPILNDYSSASSQFRPIGGLAVNDSGSRISHFGRVPDGRTQSVHIINSILTQIKELDELGSFRRGMVTLDSGKMIIFPYYDCLAGLESEIPDLASKFTRMNNAELERFFEKERGS